MSDFAKSLPSFLRAESTAYRYGSALLLVAVAYLLQSAIWPFIPPSPHLFFYPALFLDT